MMAIRLVIVIAMTNLVIIFIIMMVITILRPMT